MKVFRISVLSILMMLNFYSTMAMEVPDSLAQSTDTSYVTLDEITVSADHIRVSGSLTTISIPGTAYAKTGSALTMLPNLPGLMLSSNGIEVVGLGSPLFVLNGRELKNISELKAIKSDDVKEVKIERSPGPKYEGNTVAVVSITTKRKPNDFLYLNISNTLGYHKKIQESPDVTLKGKFGRFSTSLFYSFGHNYSKMNETYFRRINHSNYIFSINQIRRYERMNNDHQVNWSGEWQINTSNSISAFYSYNHDDEDINTSGHNVISESKDELKIRFNDTEQKNVNLHSATLLYNYTNGKTTLNVYQDFASSDNNSIYGSDESNLTSGHNYVISTLSKRKYNVYTTKIDFVTDEMPWGLWLAAGIRYAHIDSKADIKSDNPNFMSGDYRNNLTVKEDNPSAYIGLSKSFGKFMIKPGIRYQYVSRRSKNRMTNLKDSKVNQNYSSLFPWLNVTYYANQSLSAYIQYTRKMTQPNFSQLNSGIVYQDSLAYQEGNPALRTSFTESIMAGINFRHFRFSLMYMNTRNPIETILVMKNPESNTLWESATNFRRSEYVSAGLGYNNRFGKFSVYAMGYMNFIKGRLPDGKKAPADIKPSFNAQLNLSYVLNSHFSFYGNYTLQGHHNNLIFTQKTVQNFTIGANCSLLDDKLNISMQAMDIFNQAHYNNGVYSYGDVAWGTHGYNDIRRVTLTLSYTIFNKPIQIKGNTGNTEELNRIK